MLGNFLHVGWAVELAAHFINGTMIFPLVFVFILWNVLPGGPITKGAICGLALWVVAQAIVIPMIGGAGFFGAKAGGIKALAGPLIGPILYGSSTWLDYRRTAAKRETCAGSLNK